MESVIVPHIEKHGEVRNGTKRTLFIIDGAGSHKVADGLFFADFKLNKIDIAIISAPCTDEIQLMDVVVNATYKDSLYYQWAMWMDEWTSQSSAEIRKLCCCGLSNDFVMVYIRLERSEKGDNS